MASHTTIDHTVLTLEALGYLKVSLVHFMVKMLGARETLAYRDAYNAQVLLECKAITTIRRDHA